MPQPRRLAAFHDMMQLAPPTLSRRLRGAVRAALVRLAAWRDGVSKALAPVRSAVPYDWFTDAEIAGYDASFDADDPARIDDATWRDLEVKALLRRIGDGASIYARQYLFHRLRRGATFERGVRPAWMGSDTDAEQVLARTAPARLELRRQDMEVTPILFHGQLAAMPAWLRHLRWAKAAWIVALVLAFTAWGGLGVVLALGYLGVYGAVEIRFHATLALCRRQRRAVLAMLMAIADLGDVARATPHPVLDDLAAAVDDARRLLRELDFDAFERKVMATDYVNLLTLQEFAMAPARIACLEGHLARLRALYATLAECEGRLCLMTHLQLQPRWCWARESSARDVLLADMANPLLDAAQRLSLNLQGDGAFLTGQNGVGKSTFLRGVGLNLLVARAFGYCYATQAALPTVPVWSSMVHEDSIEIGDSLYMAEMRRAQTLLRVADSPRDAVFLIDEIFRGTNHIESVAGATAVLNRLAVRGAVIVSSHNVVLAPLLRARLAPWRIVRTGADLLCIEPGVLLEPNGIDMMRHYGIADDVRAEALRVHDWFAGHVATPVTFPELA